MWLPVIGGVVICEWDGTLGVAILSIGGMAIDALYCVEREVWLLAIGVKYWVMVYRRE